MASSVARMPTDDWRDPNRVAAGVFAAHAHHPFGKTRNKVLLRDRDRVGVTSPPSSSSTPMAVGGTDAVIRRKTEPSSGGGEDAVFLATQNRQSQILNRWAARQAREMITTIERQAHEAEISALTTTTQPVSARAASFLHDSSPALSDDSAASGPAADGCGAASANDCSSIDLSPNVRASSLIQMWKELEVEAGMAPSNRTTSAGGNSGFPAAAASMVEEPSGGSDVCDDLEAYGDWDSDIVTPTAHSSMSESERGRVGSIVKMLSSANATRSSTATSWSEEVEPLSRESSGVSDHGESQSLRTTRSFGVGLRRVRGRREMEDLLAKLEKERRRELAEMAERQPVSRFSYRGRLQSMLRLRALQREVAVKNQQRTVTATIELDRLQTGSTISFLRQRFSNGGQHDCSGVPHLENSSHAHIQFPTDTRGSDYSNFADQRTGDSNQYQVVVFPRDSESSPAELNSPHSRSDDLQEGSHTLDSSWDDRSLWVSNLDWQRPLDSSPSHDSQGDIITEEVESYTHQNVNSDPLQITGSPNSWRGWGVSRRAGYCDLVRKFSDNEEIRDLLERRRVSTSLASDFCDKMNHLILSFLQRQGHQSFDDNFAEDYEEQTFWRQNDEFQNADQVASASSSLIPVPYQTLNHPESWQHTTFRHHSSQNFPESGPIHDLRSDIAKIHHEISELRKLVESCMEWQQANLQHSIKQVVSDAVRQSVGLGSATKFSGPKTGRKDSCCVCYEMQVDSLLYRCGHMCTCFKCAHELQWSSGKCPICRSPIVDVVRAYPNL
ncbi:uncharacterized protein [Elaeis guineensis]|uniref:Uncharacterized protein LOC105050464 n=1 Tax=Elaeis guineensis var. tenera TaxID=51953 RepID=A0A6I9RMH7_ELAGV|nr:uncharacterized protein LOC105050464 [Elaeis guineensis]